MATPSSLSEEQFLCSICLEVFKQPVSIPCGHNFCMACVRKYWDGNNPCQCPMCQKTFDRRPELFTNSFISEMAAEFKKSVQVKCPADPGEVSCDICTGRKVKALKSCLACLTSFCETHLEPHLIALALKKHKLIDPVQNLEDRMCTKHEKLLELFCRRDQMCVCQFCMETDHKNHDTVPLEQEHKERTSEMERAEEVVEQMIQERLEKIHKIKHSIVTIKRNVEKEISVSAEVFTALTDVMRSIERSQAEHIKVIEEKRNAAEKQAEEFIKDLGMEITELQRRSTELKRLSHTGDSLYFLQTFPSLSTSPQTKDWSAIRVQADLGIGTAVSHLEEMLRNKVEELAGVKLKMMQQYAVDVTLDPDTVNYDLILSEDGKQVRHGGANELPDNPPENPERFKAFFTVLGKQSFSSGRFYYEVQVKGKTDWALGVASESINRKGDITYSYSPSGGVWSVQLVTEQRSKALAGPVVLSLNGKTQKVGVFVDYEQGQVSFYDVEAKAHIYSFTACIFTEKIYPFFNPYNNNKGNNSAPLIITPVNP